MRLENFRRMRVCVASSSDVKLEAVMNAFKGIEVDKLVGVSVDSGVSDQPSTEKETRTGAQNRLTAAKEKKPGFDVYVSIENGIEKCGNGYRDFACVMLDGGVLPAVTIYSASIPVPFGDLAVETGRTYGDLMSETDPSVDPKDPHATLCGVSRVTILSEAVEIGLGILLKRRASLGKIRSF